jgi:hypothetical protein
MKKDKVDLNKLASMSPEEFSKFLKEMPYSEDRIGQGFVMPFRLPKSATNNNVQSKISESERNRNAQ